MGATERAKATHEDMQALRKGGEPTCNLRKQQQQWQLWELRRWLFLGWRSGLELVSEYISVAWFVLFFTTMRLGSLAC